ncbi:MAG: galactokinase [Treponema sp.]|nr:galactokinase [Treponema sp.]
MLDIGPIHRREYELPVSRAGGSSGGKAGASGRQTGKDLPSKGKSAKEGNNANTVIIAQAPGRIHFLGEQGDSGDGLYLSAAVDRWVKIAVSARKDNALRFYAADLGERKRATFTNLKYKREDRWANYIKVAIHVFGELGFSVKGLNFTLIGNIPQQIGLASSSAIEVAAAVALRGFLGAKIGEQELAQRLAASHLLFFEEKPNLVDYIVGLSARSDQFLLIDASTQAVTKIKSPFSRCKFILMDSRVPRLGVDSELAARREDLKTGLHLLSQGREGASFRDFVTMDLMDSMGNLPEEVRRRSLYVVQEMQRVLDAADYLQRADVMNFARLIFHSHESLRDLYEVSCPEIDWMVKRAQETIGVFGARMTGLGFGGCTYAIVKNEAINEYRTRIDDYERIFGFHPGIYEMKLAAGSKVVGE